MPVHQYVHRTLLPRIQRQPIRPAIRATLQVTIQLHILPTQRHPTLQLRVVVRWTTGGARSGVANIAKEDKEDPYTSMYTTLFCSGYNVNQSK